MIRKILAALAALAVTPALAEPPRVVTDIAPVQSLVAMVAGETAVPPVLVPPGGSPHGAALKPSQARALQQADLVIWIGPGLTPWLEKPVATLADAARELRLMEVAGTRHYALRDGDGHDHGHAHGHEDGETEDPHAWLDPENASLWLDAIAGALAETDPAQAQDYRARAAAARAALAALDGGIDARLAPLREVKFVTYHDAFQYFERRYGLQSAGAIAPSDATSPGPAWLAHIRDEIAEHGVKCVFSEPQFQARLVEAVAEGQEVRVVPLDPLGSALEPGAALYPALLSDMAAAMLACLGGPGQ